MSTEVDGQPHSFADLPLLYGRLIDKYRANIKQNEEKTRKEGRDFFRSLWTRNSRESGPRSGTNSPGMVKVISGLYADLNLFGCEVLDEGGLETFVSLQSLDRATLAALIELNRINVALIEEKLFLRRLATYFLASVSLAATLSKFEFIHNNDVQRILVIWGDILFRQWWLGYLALMVNVVFEIWVWRPGRSRLIAFGQMLAVAFAYRSKQPIPERHQAKAGHR